MQHLVTVVFLVFLGVSCKAREYNSGANAQAVRPGASTLIGKKLVVTCLNPKNNEEVVATTTEAVKALKEKAEVDVKWPQGTFSVAGTLIPYDELSGDERFWRIEVKFLAPAFYSSWINATFDKNTLKSLDPATATFPSTGNDVLVVDCTMKIVDSGTGSIPEGIATPQPGTGSIPDGIAPTVAKYSCPAIRSFPPVLFLSMDSCKAKCPRSSDPAQQCKRVE